MNSFIQRIRNNTIVYMRKHSDKFVSEILPEGEKLLWSGRPGFVATFNSHEIVMSLVITAVITLFVVIMTGQGEFPAEFNAIVTVCVCGLVLLSVGWIRQLCRYLKTLGMYYAVTDLRVVIIKHRVIISEIPTKSIRTSAVYIKSRLFRNGSVVFNEGADYFRKGNMIESPSRSVFVFFNVIDPENAVESTVE